MIHDKVNIILCQKGEDYYFQRLILANTLFAAEIIMMRYVSTTASYTLLENYLITEPFLVHIFPYSVRMREDTDQKNSVFGHFSCSDSHLINLFNLLVSCRSNVSYGSHIVNKDIYWLHKINFSSKKQ